MQPTLLFVGFVEPFHSKELWNRLPNALPMRIEIVTDCTPSMTISQFSSWIRSYGYQAQNTVMFY
ncbi:hypothetical protein SETIT_3G306800v2 [Setaria italica]|uniref:Uncharacterized protein n=1 Tax=Setaria italica TaxID=4555 RepID=A0A368QKP6_SETIT|nr:hypothetical protein SETIT_3G306800v2 [Setaria italica]